jgi:hypothetical protein
MAAHDACPKCGGPKRTKNRQCANCYGYGRKRHVAPSGYVRVWRPGHPVANGDGYALEHRAVLYDAGVPIPQGTHVHHRNGDRQDNRLENLEVLAPVDHVHHHIAGSGGVTNQFGKWPLKTDRECERCGKSFRPWKRAGRFCSRTCANQKEAA